MKGVFLCYKGFCAFAKYHEEDGVFHGIIEGLSDLVTFGGETEEALAEDFKNAVDDYLDGDEVDTSGLVSTLRIAIA